MFVSTRLANETLQPKTRALAVSLERSRCDSAFHSNIAYYSLCNRCLRAFWKLLTCLFTFSESPASSSTKDWLISPSWHRMLALIHLHQSDTIGCKSWLGRAIVHDSAILVGIHFPLKSYRGTLSEIRPQKRGYWPDGSCSRWTRFDSLAILILVMRGAASAHGPESEFSPIDVGSYVEG